MSKFNKICIICKSKYDYCPTCAKYANQPRWKMSFCSENCLKIYELLRDYKCGKISSEIAIEMLNSLDTSLSERYSGSFAETYKELICIKNIDANNIKDTDNEVLK